MAENNLTLAAIVSLAAALLFAGCGSSPVEEPEVLPSAPVEPHPGVAPVETPRRPVPHPVTPAPGPRGPPVEGAPPAEPPPASVSAEDLPAGTQIQGSGAAPPEPSPHVSMGVPGVPGPVPTRPQTRSGGGAAAVLRAYLARRFIYAWWYSRIREVTVRHRSATVSSWHLGQKDPDLTARKICQAVLSSHRVAKVRVRYKPGYSVDCP